MSTTHFGPNTTGFLSSTLGPSRRPLLCVFVVGVDVVHHRPPQLTLDTYFSSLEVPVVGTSPIIILTSIIHWNRVFRKNVYDRLTKPILFWQVPILSRWGRSVKKINKLFSDGSFHRPSPFIFWTEDKSCSLYSHFVSYCGHHRKYLCLFYLFEIFCKWLDTWECTIVRWSPGRLRVQGSKVQS